MKSNGQIENQRRHFLKWAAASPLLATSGIHEVLAQTYGRRPDPMVWSSNLNLEDLIKSPAEAINVFDFEPVAHRNVPPAHFGYMASGIDDEITLRANRESFLKYQLRPRRMRDVSSIDMSINLFGSHWKTPLILAPTGGNKAYHPDGELGVARAAKNKGHLNVLSSAASATIEDTIAARQGEVWYQSYATSSLEVAQKVVRRVDKAGSTVLEITVDRNGGRNQETMFRLKRQDPRQCNSCHIHGPGSADERPNFAGIDMSNVKSMQSSNMTWDFVQKMRDTTKMKIVLKGILTEEDAELCLKYGVDGIHVSNHGGRSEDAGRASIDCLSEIAKVAKGKIPIIFDSGIRRGTDIFKAMALGADAVCIGRPYLWGLGAFGQEGVERVLEILDTELFGIMQQMGATRISEIRPEMIYRG